MKREIYVTGIVKDSKCNLEKYLFTENERLNAIIDDYEERIDKVIDYIKENFTNEDGFIWHEDMRTIYKILGDKE